MITDPMDTLHDDQPSYIAQARYAAAVQVIAPPARVSQDGEWVVRQLTDAVVHCLQAQALGYPIDFGLVADAVLEGQAYLKGA